MAALTGKIKISDHKTLEEFVKDKGKREYNCWEYALAAMAKKNNVTFQILKTEVSKQASQHYKAMTDSEKDYTDAKKLMWRICAKKYKLAEKHIFRYY